MNLTTAILLVVQTTRWLKSVRRRLTHPAENFEFVIPNDFPVDYYSKHPRDFFSESLPGSLNLPVHNFFEFPIDDFTVPPVSPPIFEAYPEIPRRIHEVFLSFRGEDTRASFISHLQHALQNAAINVFKDDDSIERGNMISDSLLQAIEDSEISVVVFSTSYAESRWCLEELAKIMDWRRTGGQVVLPVFYDVDPSEVRHQTGEFGNAFQSLLNRIPEKEHNWLSLSVEVEVGNEEPLLREYLEQRWRSTLREAAGLAGFVVLNSRNESEAIKDIVENVTHLLDKTDLLIANNPVGIESRVQDMIQLLDLDNQQSNDVLLLGMWGMGGIGKTTIAKAIYNKIGRNFEGRCFLANIREAWEQNGGQVHLQERLLFDIFKGTTTTIQCIESGKVKLKDRLNLQRVLIVLDDVNELEQLDALCGSREWFWSIIFCREQKQLKGLL